MMADDSDSSGLSEHSEKEFQYAPIFMKAKKATKLAAPPPVVSPPRPKRPPSPPHEEVLADNPDIAVSFVTRNGALATRQTPHVRHVLIFGVVTEYCHVSVEIQRCYAEQAATFRAAGC